MTAISSARLIIDVWFRRILPFGSRWFFKVIEDNYLMLKSFLLDINNR